MITFSNPKKEKMASGQNCIELTEEGTWESFPAFAEQLVKQINAKTVNKIVAPDCILWEIVYNDVKLKLVYDDFPNGVSIEPFNQSDNIIINELFEIFYSQKSVSGI